MPGRKWTEREYRAFKEWEKRFDRLLWWALGAVVFLPVVAFVFTAMTK